MFCVYVSSSHICRYLCICIHYMVCVCMCVLSSSLNNCNSLKRPWDNMMYILLILGSTKYFHSKKIPSMESK